jgi:hypothetical protein
MVKTRERQKDDCEQEQQSANHVANPALDGKVSAHEHGPTPI